MKNEPCPEEPVEGSKLGKLYNFALLKRFTERILNTNNFTHLIFQKIVKIMDPYRLLPPPVE